MSAKIDGPVNYSKPPPAPAVGGLLSRVMLRDAHSAILDVQRGLHRLLNRPDITYDMAKVVRWIMGKAGEVEKLLDPQLPGLESTTPASSKRQFETYEELEAFCLEEAAGRNTTGKPRIITEQDSIWFWEKMRAQAEPRTGRWKVAGRFVADCRALLRQWHDQGDILPSHRAALRRGAVSQDQAPNVQDAQRLTDKMIRRYGK